MQRRAVRVGLGSPLKQARQLSGLSLGGGDVAPLRPVVTVVRRGPARRGGLACQRGCRGRPEVLLRLLLVLLGQPLLRYP